MASSQGRLNPKAISQKHYRKFLLQKKTDKKWILFFYQKLSFSETPNGHKNCTETRDLRKTLAIQPVVLIVVLILQFLLYTFQVVSSISIVDFCTACFLYACCIAVCLTFCSDVLCSQCSARHKSLTFEKIRTRLGISYIDKGLHDYYTTYHLTSLHITY